MTSPEIQAARLAASWLLTYPDEALIARLPELREVASTLPDSMRVPLQRLMTYLESLPLLEHQQQYVATFDMKRKTSLYLTYWTHGDTRNRGTAILRFKMAYQDAGWTIGGEELPDHLAVLLEFAAVADSLTGDALLLEHAAPLGLLRDALAKLQSPYRDLIEVVLSTMPALSPQVKARMAQLAAAGPPQELVGLEGYGATRTLEISEVRR